MSDPKIEPWMVAAASEIWADHIFDKRGTAIVDMSEEAIASMIARHAPAQDQAIGPGDVVQLTQACDIQVENMLLGFDKSEFVLVQQVTENGVQRGKCVFPLSHVVRVGRAKYWPDGSLVEGGGK